MKQGRHRGGWCLVALGLLLALGAASAGAAQWPGKPVRWVLGPAPDVLPRMVAQRLTEAWAQQVIIDQRPGAGGIIAAELVAKAPADGYTWLMTTGAYATLVGLYPKLPFDFSRDLAPVTLMATIPFAMVVNPSVPAKTLPEFIRLARAQPGKLNYASGGAGTTSHLAAEMFNRMAKVNIVHVPYKGVAAGVIDLLGGQVQMMFAIMQGAMPHVQTGKLRILAVSSAKRSTSAPEVPTIAESGVPGFEFISWNALHVPAGTPGPVIAAVNREVARALADPEVRKRMFALGLEVTPSTPGELGALVRADIEKWSKVIKEVGIKLD